MKIILWIISPLIFIIGITGVTGMLAIPLKEVKWNDSWFDKMIIINAIIITIIILLFGIILGTWFIHEMLWKLIDLI